MDGSFLKSSSRGGIGGLIRDSKGRVLVQFCEEVSVDSAFHAEVLALREGFWLRRHRIGFHRSASSSNQIPNQLLNGSHIPYRLHGSFTICLATAIPFSAPILIGRSLTLAVPIMMQSTRWLN